MSHGPVELSVLYIDADRESADRISRLLERADEGLTVHIATELSTAFERIGGGDIDCLLSEYAVPEIDGIRILQTVRAEYPDLPFVLYTADGSEELASAAFAADASDYIRKSDPAAECQEVATRLRAAVERARTRGREEPRNERARRILDASPDAIVVCTDRKIVYANDAAVTLFGSTDPGELLGRTLGTLIRGDPEQWEYDSVQSGERVLTRHREVLRTGADRVDVEMTANQVAWDQQDGVVVIFRDVSQQPDWEAEAMTPRNQLEGVVETLSAAVFLKDTEGQYLLMSGCRHLLGVDPDTEVVGKTDEELFDEEVAAEYVADDEQVFETAEQSEREEVMSTPDGERTRLTRKKPMTDDDGNIYALCGISTDITPQKEREQALTKRVKELSAIHRTVDLFDSKDHRAADVFEQFVETLPESFKYPEKTEARVQYGSVTATTAGFEAVGHALVATAETDHGQTLQIEVRCTAPSEGDDDPFLPGERSLLETLVTVLAGHLERRNQIDELERYETTLRALGDPVYALDSDGRFTFVNDALLEQTGYESEEILGEYPTLVMSAETVERGTDVIRELVADDEKQSAKWEMEVETADGEWVPVENHIAVLPSEDGEFRGTAGVIRDITERTNRQAELQRRKDLLVRTERMADVGGWEFDTETEQLYWTEGTRLIHEVTEEYEPTLDDALRFYSPEHRERIEDAVQACLESGTPYDFESRLTTARGRECWIRTRGERVEENGSTKLRGTIQDITTLRENEQQLMVLNRVLRHNLRNNLNVVTANAEMLREQFEAFESITALPEETRQRLPSLLSESPPVESDVDAVENALETVATFPAETVVDQLEQLETNAWELLAMAEKSRKLAGAIEEIGSGETVDIDSLLPSLVEEYRIMFSDASITLKTLDVQVDGNPASVRLAVEELLENALKHGGTDPTVTVTVRELTDDRIGVTIADDGPGIPEMEQKALEEGEETALKHGSGLGLWTVNWLVSRLGGAVTLEECDSGTSVRLELPAK